MRNPFFINKSRYRGGNSLGNRRGANNASRGTVNPWKYLDLQRSQDKTRDKTTEQEISDARNKVELICDSLKFN